MSRYEMDPDDFDVGLRDDFLDFLDVTDGVLLQSHLPSDTPPLFGSSGSGSDSPPSPLFVTQPFNEEQPGAGSVRPPFPHPGPLGGVPPPRPLPGPPPPHPPAPLHSVPPAPFAPPGLRVPPPGPQFQRQALSQFSTVSNQMQQPTRPFQKLFQSRFPFPGTRPKLLTLVEGFINPVKAKMPGGADNARACLPKQVLELNLHGIPPGLDPRRLGVRALLVGWDRAAKERKVLSELSTRRFVPIERHSPMSMGGMGPMGPMGRMNPMMHGGGMMMGGPGSVSGVGPGVGPSLPPTFVVIFDDLIIRFSSAYHGIKGRLYLQFLLLDEQKNVVDSVESQGFQTITKRGLEKQRERLRLRREQTTMRQKQSVVSCQPSVGLTNGALLVRIRGEGFLASPLVPSVVTFGDRRAREIVSIRRDVIVCETPMHDPGLVSVNVSLDGRSFIPNSQAKFLYVAPHDQNGLRTMMTCLMNPHQVIDFGPPRQQPRGGGGGGGGGTAPGDDLPLDDDELDVYNSPMQYEYRNFVSGAIVDPRGFSILHHAAARGYFELLSLLFGLHSDSLDVNQTDNFGRTPLSWAIMSARPFVTSCLLIAAGARIELADTYGDTPLHLAAREFESLDIPELKKILFYYLKNDDEYQSRTRTLQRLLGAENLDGMTPIQVGGEEDGIRELLRKFEVLCEQHLRTFRGESIQIRSGNLNGTVIDKTPRQPMEIEFYPDKMEIMIDSSTRAVVPNDDLGFIILAKVEERVEFTLHRCAQILLKVGEAWKESAEDHLMKCLSFHLHSEISELRRLHRHFTATFGEMMYEFKPWSFVYRSPRMVMKRKKTMSSRPRRRHTHVLERKLRAFKQSNLGLLQELRNRRLESSRPDVPV